MQKGFAPRLVVTTNESPDRSLCKHTVYQGFLLSVDHPENRDQIHRNPPLLNSEIENQELKF